MWLLCLESRVCSVFLLFLELDFDLARLLGRDSIVDVASKRLSPFIRVFPFSRVDRYFSDFFVAHLISSRTHSLAHSLQVNLRLL